MALMCHGICEGCGKKDVPYVIGDVGYMFYPVLCKKCERIRELKKDTAHLLRR